MNIKPVASNLVTIEIGNGKKFNIYESLDGDELTIKEVRE